VTSSWVFYSSDFQMYLYILFSVFVLPEDKEEVRLHKRGICRVYQTTQLPPFMSWSEDTCVPADWRHSTAVSYWLRTGNHHCFDCVNVLSIQVSFSLVTVLKVSIGSEVISTKLSCEGNTSGKISWWKTSCNGVLIITEFRHVRKRDASSFI